MADNIYRRGAVWYGRVWIAGKEHRRSLQTSDEAAATREVERWRKELTQRHEMLGSIKGSWRDAVVNWSETIGAMGDDGLKPGTKARYLDSLRQSDFFFGDKQLDQIGRKEIADFVRSRKKGYQRPLEGGSSATFGPVTNATIRRDLTALSSVFRAAVAAGMTTANPAKEWDRGVIRERRMVFVPPTLAEIDTVLAYAESHGNFRHLIAFAAQTGVRQSEAAGIEWAEVRADRGEVLLPRTKAGRPRIVALNTPGGDARSIVATLPRHLRSGILFWHGVGGERYSHASESFRDLVNKAVAGEAVHGRPFRRFRFHDLRHAFAVRWLQAGGDIYALSRHLGHTSVKTTEIYLQYVDTYREDRHTHRHTSGGL